MNSGGVVATSNWVNHKVLHKFTFSESFFRTFLAFFFNDGTTHRPHFLGL